MNGLRLVPAFVRWLPSAVVLLFVAGRFCGPALAATAPSEAYLGYVDNTFASGSIGDVNLFNGNLALSIPIGPALQVGPSLAWQASLTYNSQIWRIHTTSLAEPAKALLRGMPFAGVGWTFNPGYISALNPESRATPTPGPGIRYVAPDGSEHTFDPESAPASVSGWSGGESRQFYRSNDLGGLLFLCDENPQFPLSQAPVMWDAAGNRYDFEFLVQGFGGYSATDQPLNDFGLDHTRWVLTRISDEFGHSIQLYYNDTAWDDDTANEGSPYLSVGQLRGLPYKIATSDGRVVRFAYDTTQTVPNLSGVTVFPGTPRAQTWGLEYVTDTHPRSGLDNWRMTSPNTYSPNSVTALYLRRIKSPGDIAVWTFDYNHADTYDSAGPEGLPGTLSQITLPTGGTVAYSYGRWRHSVLSTIAQDKIANERFTGVASRTETRRVNDTTESSTTRYEQAIWYATYTAPKRVFDAPCGYVTHVSPPSDSDGRGFDTLVGFEGRFPGARGPNGIEAVRYLFNGRIDQSGVLEAAKGMSLCDWISPEEKGTKPVEVVRVVESVRDADWNAPEKSVTKDYDPADGALVYSRESTFDKNAWVSTGWTQMRGGPGSSLDTDKRVRSVTVASHVSASHSGNDVVVHFHPGTESAVNVTEIGKPGEIKVVRKVDPSTGLVEQETTYGSSMDEARTRRVFRYYGPSGSTGVNGGIESAAQAGFLYREEIGTASCGPSGDCTGVPLGDETTFTPDQIIESEWEKGILVRARFRNPSALTANTWYATNRVVDESGFITSEMDERGYPTSYSYDELGRITEVHPLPHASLPAGPDEAWVRFSYPSLTHTVQERIYPEGCAETGCSVVGKTEQFSDEFGRPIVTVRNMPAGTPRSYQVTSYDPSGRAFHVSEWRSEDGTENFENRQYGSGVVFPGTKIRGRDAFGRSLTTVLADGSRIDRSFRGEFESAATVYGVNEAPGSLASSASTKTVYDTFGRVRQVCEPNPTTGAADCVNRLTTFTYQFWGAPSAIAKKGGATGTQTRSWTFDSVGRPKTETHPESGITTYVDYDARGNLLESVDARGVRLCQSYDYFGRLSGVRTGASEGCSGGLSLVSMFYDDTTIGKQNRLVQATRANPSLIGGELSIDVTELFDYNPADGRGVLTNYELSFSDPALPGKFGMATRRFFEVFDERPLESVETTYPSWNTGAEVFGPPRMATLRLDQGWPVKLDGVGLPAGVAQAAYHPSGMAKSLTLGNAVNVTYGAHTLGMPRLREISAVGTTELWSTGEYLFDGAGNIRGIGPDRYSYDFHGRLTTADLASQRLRQAWQYDGFGNIETRTNAQLSSIGVPGQQQAVDFTIDPASNRLTEVPGVPGAIPYDAAGNVAAWGNEAFLYDALGRLWSSTRGSTMRRFLYSASGERVATRVSDGGTSTWEVEVRGLGRSVMSRFEVAGASKSLTRDNVLWGAMPVASSDECRGGVDRWYVNDHLGSARLAFDGAGAIVERHDFLPYGDEATGEGAGSGALTGYESEFGLGFDYAHMRTLGRGLGRFLQPDPRRLSGGTWSLYGYVGGNPIGFVDPSGTQMVQVSENCWKDTESGEIYCSDEITVSGGKTEISLVDLAGRYYCVDPRSGREYLSYTPCLGGAEERIGPAPTETPPEPCSGAAIGISLDVSTINPWSSGGGGVYGINIESGPREEAAVYFYYTPNDIRSTGFDVGGSLTLNAGFGDSGEWTGRTEQVTGSYGLLGGGAFWSPSTDPSSPWTGGQAGLSVGLPGVGSTTTEYLYLFDIPFLKPKCAEP